MASLPRLLTGSLLVLAALARSSVGAAQDDPDTGPDTATDGSDDQEQAKADRVFRRAQRAFEEEDYETALRGFRRAQELAPHPAVRFNVAVCLESLERNVEALEHYEALAQSESLPRERREVADRRAREIRSNLGKLHVEGDWQGAVVRIDGDVQCTVPCTTWLEPGARTVVVGGGSDAIERKLEVEPGDTVEIAADRSEPQEGITFSEPVPPSEPAADDPPPAGEEPQPEPDRDSAHPVSWPTYTSFATGVVFAGVYVYSAARLARIQKDLNSWREQTPTNFDSCNFAKVIAEGDPDAQDARRARSLCNEGDRLFKLGWASVALSLAAGVTGAVLLYFDLSDDDEAQTERSLRILPRIGRRHGGLDATLRF